MKKASRARASRREEHLGEIVRRCTAPYHLQTVSLHQRGVHTPRKIYLKQENRRTIDNTTMILVPF